MGDFGLKIAKEGYDVDTADPKDLIFSSKLPCLKILQAGNKGFTANTGGSTITEVNFYPVISFPIVVLVFVWDPSDSSYKGAQGEPVPDHTQNYRPGFYFDSSKLYVEVENYTGGNITSHFIYFICYA